MPLMPEGCSILSIRDTPEGVVAIWRLWPGEDLRFVGAEDVDGVINVMREAARRAREGEVVSVEGDAWLAALASAMRRLWLGYEPDRPPIAEVPW